MKTNGNEPITPFADIEGRIASNVDMSHLEGMGAMIGLSKREYFAGLAMQGLMAMPDHPTEGGMGMIEIAVKSVRMADLLIIELNK